VQLHRERVRISTGTPAGSGGGITIVRAGSRVAPENAASSAPSREPCLIGDQPA
jgi:hypothetical protein